MKAHFKQLISEGKTEKVIKELIQITSNLEDQDLQQEVIIQSGRFKEYQQQKRKGEEKPELLPQINFALLQIIGQLPEEIIVKTSKRHWWELVVGAGVILGILGGIAEFSGINIKDFFSITSTASNTVTVLVHGPGGKDDKVLPSRGMVKLIYGDAIVIKQINKDAEVTFTQISDAFFAKDARVEILFEDPEGEPYRAVRNDSLYQLERGKYVALEVKLYGLEHIKGIVKDFNTGKAIEEAMVRVQGVETTSNAKYGEFTLKLPPDKQQKFQTIRAFHPDYQDYEMAQVPTQTQTEISILMKPKK